MSYYRRSRGLLVGALATVLTLSACSSGENARESNSKGPVTTTPAQEETLPPEVVAEIGARDGANFLADAGGSMWLTETDAGSLARIDPATNEVAARVRLGHAPDFMSAGLGYLWVSSSADGLLWRIDGTSGQVVGPAPVATTAYGSNPGFGSMWLADHDGNRLIRLDPETLKPTGKVAVPSAADVVAGFGRLWVASEEQKVYEIDPSTLRVVEVIGVEAAHAIAVAYGSVWVSAGGESDVVTRIDPRTGKKLAEIETTVAGFPDRLAAAGGLLWVGQYQAPTILGIDPKTNEVTKELPVGSGAAVVWPAFGDLWVANFDDATVWRLTTDG